MNSSSFVQQALTSSFPAELVALMTNTLPVLRRSSASFLFRSVSSIRLSSGLRISSLSSPFLFVTVGVAMGWLIFWASCPSFFASWSCKNFAMFLLGYKRRGAQLCQTCTCAGNLRPAMEARNQVGIGLSYRPASLRSLATQFQTRFLESIPRPIAGLKIPTLDSSSTGSQILKVTNIM
jgi:hypothetical protein